ncbi:MAG: glycoside hydrolase family 2 TIM barrel-domain containing protein [Breznakibacter sp.]
MNIRNKLFVSATLLSLFFAINSILLAQAPFPDWENPEVFAINKEDTRATALPYPSEALALKDDYAASPYYRLLDGNWKFHWVPKIAEVPAGFWNENYDVSQWKEIPVPGTWEMNGYGIPMYVGVKYGIPINPPYIDKEDSPAGAYRHTFDIPESWDGRRVFIHFEAGTNSMYVWVNGQKVGYTENSKSPSEFDITKYIRKGKNTLACQVHKYSDGYYLEDQDMWRLGGINRSVYLYSTAQTRILDFFAHPDLDKDYKNGIFSADIKLKNYSPAEKVQQIEVAVLDKNEKKVFGKSQKIAVPASGIRDVTFSGTISNPLKWTAETPNLYTLLITLKEDDKVIESTSHKIGFRKIEIKDGQVFVNGKKIYIKGANVHEFNAFTGNVVTRREMMRNIQLMKELNVNAVRTSHYQQQPLWYKLCDEYGIYLVDENNLESHGLGFGKDNVSNFPEWHAAHMDRIYRLVERDKNHASVIFWSLGNEASNGKAFFDMYDWVKERDKSRPVQYEQGFKYSGKAEETASNTDIIAPMYPAYYRMKEEAARDLGRPYIMCEYAHAMGNSMGNFQEYWDVIRSSKNMQGGFIWEWYNQGYPEYDEQGNFFWAYGGDLNGYKNLYHDNFCMDGLITPDQNYMPHTYIVKKVYQNILFKAKDLNKGIVTVINDFKFTDLTPDNYTFKWVLLKNGKPENEGSFNQHIKADSPQDIKLDIPAVQSKEGDEYFLQVYAFSKEATPFLPVGFEIAKEEFAYPVNNYFVAKERSGGSVEVKQMLADRSERIMVTADSMTYEFDTKNPDGGLLRMTNNGKRIFYDLPELNFWRAPTDNDMGVKIQTKLAAWKDAGKKVKYKYIGREDVNGNVSVKYECSLREIQAKLNLTYTVNKDGSLTVDADYKPLADTVPEMVRFGMIMTLPKEYNDFTWYGRGPYENYIDRNRDAFMGIYNGKVEDQAYPYYRPQETGNKTDVRWLTLKQKNGHGILIEGAQPLSVTATNNRPEDMDAGPVKKQWHPTDVPKRNETVLCVDIFQRGVAGTDSWSINPLDQYRFWGNKEHRYSYTIRVVE